jgi:hypothetical protein
VNGFPIFTYDVPANFTAAYENRSPPEARRSAPQRKPRSGTTRGQYCVPASSAAGCGWRAAKAVWR